MSSIEWASEVIIQFDNKTAVKSSAVKWEGEDVVVIDQTLAPKYDGALVEEILRKVTSVCQLSNNTLVKKNEVQQLLGPLILPRDVSLYLS